MDRPKTMLPIQPANAPTVAWEASAKLGKRSTAYIAVRPMAGTARMVPAISPLITSCATSPSNQATFTRFSVPFFTTR